MTSTEITTGLPGPVSCGANEVAVAMAPALRAAEIEAVFWHAHTWACPGTDPDRARLYAQWYVARFVLGSDMSELPAHPDVWADFLDSRS
jgi:hypothetical protein